MATKEKLKFSKAQILKSAKYKDFYVLTELLKDDVAYSIDEVDKMLKPFRKDVK